MTCTYLRSGVARPRPASQQTTLQPATSAAKPNVPIKIQHQQHGDKVPSACALSLSSPWRFDAKRLRQTLPSSLWAEARRDPGSRTSLGTAEPIPGSAPELRSKPGPEPQSKPGPGTELGSEPGSGSEPGLGPRAEAVKQQNLLRQWSSFYTHNLYINTRSDARIHLQTIAM